MSLQRFESFVPKNIEQRQQKFLQIQKQKEETLLSLIPTLEQNIDNLYDVKSEDINVNILLGDFRDVIIKKDFLNYPETLFFFKREQNMHGTFQLKYIGEYNLREFWILYDIFYLLENRIGYNNTKKLIKAFITKYFGLKDFVLEDGSNYRKSLDVEIHFSSLDNLDESFVPKNIDQRSQKLSQIQHQKEQMTQQMAFKLKESIKILKPTDHFSQKMTEILKDCKIVVDINIANKIKLINAIMIYSNDNFWLIRIDLDWDNVVFYSGEHLYEHFWNLDAKAFSDTLREFFKTHLDIEVPVCYRSAGEHPPLSA